MRNGHTESDGERDGERDTQSKSEYNARFLLQPFLSGYSQLLLNATIAILCSKGNSRQRQVKENRELCRVRKTSPCR